MFNLKKFGFILLFLISLNLFGFTFPSSSTNFYISDVYTEDGVKVNYSAVVNAEIIDNFSGNKQLSLQLTSFYIEDAKFNDRIYRDNDIFGISFPIDTAVEITAEIKFLYGVKLLNKTIVLHPKKKTVLDLSANEIDFSDSQFNAKKTLSVQALHDHETFIDDIKEAIENNSSRKSPEAIEQEHTRLMMLGNNYLNENNYKQAIATYQHAKKYTTDISYAESQIFTTAKYAERYNLTVDTEYVVHNTVDKDYYTKKQPSIFNQNKSSKNNAVTNKNSQGNNSNNKEYRYSSERRSNEPVYAVNDDDPNADEYEYEYESDEIPEATTIFDMQEAEFEFETEDVKTSNNNAYASNTFEVEYETEYESEDGKPINVQSTYTKVSNPVNPISSVNKKSSGIKTIIKPKSSGIKKVVSKKEIVIKKPSSATYEVIRTKKGYIKYRKDEQAIVDRAGNILIPYGKHEIIRYRAGFARIKLKDDVEIKNIVCENSNEEYNWSARIYENPWKETVIDKTGAFVDKVVKKVEIYIVDNVNNIPNSELSPTLLNRYKDPNPFKGTDQISAFNLWNREHSNTPSVIEKRSEIERLKKITKDLAFEGAEECRAQVSKNFEEVYKYYQDMGYEIILKD